MASSAEPWWWPVAAAFNISKIVVTGRPAQPHRISECEPERATRLICDFRKMPARETEMLDREAADVKWRRKLDIARVSVVEPDRRGAAIMHWWRRRAWSARS